MSILHELREFFEPVLLALGTDAAKVPDYLAMIKPATDAKNGDYQANFCMAMAKAMGKKPQELARDVVGMLPTDDLVESATVAGPGFINLKLKDAWLAERLAATRSGAIPNPKAKTFVIDYSGPNVAKPLHVGHLRSTIIGDSLVRILRFQGHTVIGDNHLGDWGTQFGILIYGYKNHRDQLSYELNPVGELARLYIQVRKIGRFLTAGHIWGITSPCIFPIEVLSEKADHPTDWSVEPNSLLASGGNITQCQVIGKRIYKRSSNSIAVDVNEIELGVVKVPHDTIFILNNNRGSYKYAAIGDSFTLIRTDGSKLGSGSGPRRENYSIGDPIRYDYYHYIDGKIEYLRGIPTSKSFKFVGGDPSLPLGARWSVEATDKILRLYVEQISVQESLTNLALNTADINPKEVDDDDEGASIILEECRKETAKLHAGDPENVALWTQFMPACLEMLRPIYERLDVKIDHALGESFYNPMLPGVVQSLLAKGIAVESNGALVIPNAKGIVPEAGDTKEEPPALIRKRDGAFTYTTTDMATIQYRAETWKPDALLYVVDARQALHFKTVYANARRWGYDQIEYQHVAFGSILGKDKRPFKTRDGGTIELSSLLDEAASEALTRYEQSRADRIAKGYEVPELDDAGKLQIAEIIGIGGVKYADLSGNRTSDYVFDYDKMLADTGNTATYMMYAYARCKAIFRKGQIDFDGFTEKAISLSEPAERSLALQLLKFPDAVEEAAAKYEPHHIAAYLFDLAKTFNGFFETCPVLIAATPELKSSRLMLVKHTGQTIRTALGLLGIGTVEQM